MADKKVFTDSELLEKMYEELTSDYYTFGAYTEYDGLDVKNLKHPLFDK
jgi:hypothetical protein